MKNLLILAQQVPQQIHINNLPQTKASDGIANAIVISTVVLGALSLLFLLIGAGRYAVSGGDPGQTKQARDTILYSIIGLIVSTSAFFIVQFVLGSINNP